MSDYKLDIDLLPLLDALNATLQREPSVVRQQQALELLIVQRAMKMGSAEHAWIAVEGVYKHTKQLLAQFIEGAAKQTGH